MSFDQSTTVPVGPRLKGFKDWSAWFTWLRFDATMRGVWEFVDPDAPDAPEFHSTSPKFPTNADVKLQMCQEQKERHDRRHEEWRKKPPGPERGDEPIYDEKQPTGEKIIARRDQEIEIYSTLCQVWEVRWNRYMEVNNWIFATVDRRQMDLACMKLTQKNNCTLQAMVRELRDQLGPMISSEIATAQQLAHDRNQFRYQSP